jgi:hypothetical protein
VAQPATAEGEARSGLPQKEVADDRQVLRRPQHTARRARCDGGRKRLPLLGLPLLRGGNPASRRAWWASNDDHHHRKDGVGGAQRADASPEDTARYHPPEHHPHRAERYCERNLLSLPVAVRNTAHTKSSRSSIRPTSWKGCSANFACCTGF